MTQNIRNAAQSGLLSADYRRADAAADAWGRAFSCFLGIAPHLRFFVPFSGVDENFDAYDYSGQRRTMTAVSLGVTNYKTYGALVPYVALDGGADYLTRADENGLDLTLGMTIFCWFYAKQDTAAAALIAKAGATNANSNWVLSFRGDVASDPLLARVYNGVNAYDAPLTNLPVKNVWNCAALRFIPSTSVSSMLNGVIASTVAGIPANLNNSTAAMQFGAANGASLHNGDLALCAGWAIDLTDVQLVALYQATYPLFYGV